MRKHLLSTALFMAVVLSPAGAQAANGPLAYVSNGKLFLQPVGGGPATLRAGDLNAVDVAASRDGSQLAVIRGDPTHDRAASRVVLLPTAGGAGRTLSFKGLSFNSVDISPDRRTLALTASRRGESTLPGHFFAYLLRINGGRLRRLKTSTRFAYDLRFAPDGRSLVYVGGSPRGSNPNCFSIRRIRADGRADKLLYRGVGGGRPCPFSISLSPGGTSLAMAAATGVDVPAGALPPNGVYRLSLGSKAAPTLLSQTADTPAWSPDGAQIAFSAFGRDDDLQYPGKGPHGLLRIGQAGGTPTKITEQAGVTSLAWLAAPHTAGPRHARYGHPMPGK